MMREIDVCGLLGAISKANVGDEIKIADYAKVEDCELVTYKGTKICPYRNWVGKKVGDRLYIHKDYAGRVIPCLTLWEAKEKLKECKPGFPYNCIRYNVKTDEITFMEAPDFDTADEPMVGWCFTVHKSGVCTMGHSTAVWHHKWMWVLSDYDGFDYEASRRRSRDWLSKIQETAIGGSRQAWHEQCDKWGVPHARTYE